MNRISKLQLLEIERLAFDGCSQREICDATGLAKNTVAKYFPREALCSCGQLLIAHRGWCHVRYEKSETRQEVLRRMHTEQSGKPRGKLGKKPPKNLPSTIDPWHNK